MVLGAYPKKIIGTRGLFLKNAYLDLEGALWSNSIEGGAMNEKMSWGEMVKNYPDEWVALADYKENGAIEIIGTVIVHNPIKKIFHEKVRELMPQYRDIAVRYTGPLIKNPETPLLWQITHIV